jgi:hypothetical protein
MKATFLPNHTPKFNSSHRKDGSKVHFQQVSVISLAGKPMGDGRIDTAVMLRLYGTGNRNYAAIWVGNGAVNLRGTGQAGGYGYHRPSAAAAEAIRNAGIELSEDIAGVGECAIREAVMAIAKALKVKRPAIVEAFP